MVWKKAVNSARRDDHFYLMNYQSSPKAAPGEHKKEVWVIYHKNELRIAS
jgi:hypothetical protein